MNTATINTHRLTGLDYRVWLVMGASSVLCLGFLLFQNLRSAGTVAPCPTMALSVDGQQKPAVVCPPGRLLIFRIAAPAGASVRWEFDDGSTAATGASVQHKFSAEGRYAVEATVDGRCTQTVDVLVKETAGEAVQPELQIFSDSAKITAGGTVRFSAACFPAAKSLQWVVDETDQKAEGENASFSFPHPGTYTVRLTADNDPGRQQMKRIVVNEPPREPEQTPLPPSDLFPNPPIPTPSPVPPVPLNPSPALTPKTDTVAKPKILSIDPETFKGYLQEVLNESQDLSSLYPYLPYKGSTLVKSNKDKEAIQLQDFFKRYKGKTIKTLSFQRDDQAKSIQRILIGLKGGFLGFGD